MFNFPSYLQVGRDFWQIYELMCKYQVQCSELFGIDGTMCTDVQIRIRIKRALRSNAFTKNTVYTNFSD